MKLLTDRTLDVELRTLRPSALIQLAVADVRDVRKRTQEYEINMGRWHTPAHRIMESCSVPRGPCRVCLAGAVIVNHDREAGPDTYIIPMDYDRCTRYALNALDEFRKGELKSGYRRLTGIYPDGAMQKMLREAASKAGEAYIRLVARNGWYHEESGGLDLHLEDLDTVANALEAVGL